jgi:hypothetical protein
MKSFILFLIIVILGSLSLNLLGCTSLPIPLGKVWSASGEALGTVRIGIISVDKASGWNSIEGEIRGLMPLLLLEKGYRVSSEPSGAAGKTGDPAGGLADYRMEVTAIEREYLSGWKTQRSISVEVRFWRNNGEPGGPGDPENVQPLAAGRAMVSGNRSLASSRVLNWLLKMALSKALKGIGG